MDMVRIPVPQACGKEEMIKHRTGSSEQQLAGVHNHSKDPTTRTNSSRKAQHFMRKTTGILELIPP